MKKIIATLTMSCIGLLGYSQLDSTFYYQPNGTKDWWYIMPNIISFRLENDLQLNALIDSTIVNSQVFWSNDPRKMNELHLDSLISTIEKDSLKNFIRNYPNFDLFSHAVFKAPLNGSLPDSYLRTDDQILVLFHRKPDSTLISYLEQNYPIKLLHEPSATLPVEGNYSYVFKVLKEEEGDNTSFSISQLLFENEPEAIYAVTPNFHFPDALNCTVVDEMNVQLSGTNGTWHIRNTGAVIWNGIAGTNDADADVCECWSSGFTGEDIKVGVIDVASLEFNHPDLSTITQAYNLSTLPPTLETSNFSLNPNQGHSMNVMGTVGATPNNTNLGQRYAVGVAYNADIHAYIATSIDYVQITRGLQQCLDDQVDIVNMSFRMMPNAIMESELTNLYLYGRPDVNAPNGYWGTILVASTGNDDLIGSNFPANHPNVIGVGGSNPNDYRWSSNPPDGQGWIATSGQGSTYGPPENNYDVVAPSELLVTVDAVNYGNQGSYAVQAGTSFSAPIVSGIAAILLDKNSAQTAQTIREVIRNGAEKVHSNVYNYNQFSAAPGYNEQMFYGRVSCSNSLNLVPLGLNEISKVKDLVVFDLGDNTFEVILPSDISDAEIVVYSLGGMPLQTYKLNQSQLSQVINISDLSQGMYILALSDEGTLKGRFKVLKK